MQNLIALRKGMILVPAGDGKVNEQLAASLQAELMNLGCILDKQAFDAVSAAPSQWIVDYHNQVLPALAQQVGADRVYAPFYANFPEQVMAMSHFELFINAICHYWIGGQWSPPQTATAREFKYENAQFRKISLATQDQFDSIFTKMLSINTSLTGYDKTTVQWFLDNVPAAQWLARIGGLIPQTIPFKETLCILAARGIDVPVKTPTDVLRIAVHLSGGDISLPMVPKPPKPAPEITYLRRRSAFISTIDSSMVDAREQFKFKKFTRGQRNFLLGLLERTNPDAREMQVHLGRWERLGEILHPGDFRKRYPKCLNAFDQIRNQHDVASRVRTFAGSVDLAFKEDFRKGVDLLATRPGEMARRLDWLLREPKNAATGSNILAGLADKFPAQVESQSERISYVLDKFQTVAGRVSGKVLFEMWSHFDNRTKADAKRSIIIKGKRAKQKVLPPLPPMDVDLVANVKSTIMNVIKQGFAAMPSLGNVWLDERLKDVPVPFSMRSINTSVKTYVRGTHVPFREDAKVIRPFIHWFDKDGIEDLDLSVGMYDENRRQITHISFTHLKETLIGCCHSGDIRQRVGACAEYVDIPVESALKHGVRYAVVQVHNYQGRPMHTMKECVFGLMERKYAESNKTFVPKSIANCMGVANEGTSVIICVIDLKKRCYIWADLETPGGVTLEATSGKNGEILDSLISGLKMSVYDLLKAHAEARGTIVTDKTAAQTSFNWEDFVTDYTKVASFMTYDNRNVGVANEELVTA